LAELPGGEVRPILQELLNDEDRRVRLSAAIGLARAGDRAMRQELREIYAGAETNDREKLQIVLYLLETPDSSDVNVFEDAVQAGFVNVNARADLVLSLGNLGDESSIDALERSKIRLTDAQYIDQVDTAIAAIEARAREEQRPST
jgi:HEAT repeat protein